MEKTLNWREYVITRLIKASGYSAIIFVVLIFLFLLREGLPALAEVPLSALFSSRWYPIEDNYFGILPLQSFRHAEFLHNEVPGITIPDATRAALREAGDRGAEVGLELTLGLLERVGSRVAGTYVMPSFGRYEQAAELVRRLRARQG